MAGFSSLTGGGGLSASASSSAKSGDSSSGSVGIQIQGITTGGFSNAGNSTSTVPQYVWIAGVVIAALVALRYLKR